MNKKAIINAYDSLILAEKAREMRQHRAPEEKDILEILQELSVAFRKDGFTIGEITSVCELLFYVREPCLVHEILDLAERRAKVISMNGLWSIVPDSHFGE
ncbi:MAG: hypothetical protein NT098_04110 [Candidatus Parcubacteria bacterium]|nr:hypothetical protein [Candidatus Parcubacteria bacterium]